MHQTALAHVRRNVVAYLALFTALGGTSYAATKLPAKSVGAKQLKANAVTSSSVKDGSLTAADFAPGTLKSGAAGAAGKDGAAGPAGAQGPAGAKGDPAPGTHLASGLKKLTATTGAGTTVTLLTAGPITYTANCLDQGGGSFRSEMRIQSSQAGTIATSQNGFTDLIATPVSIWNVVQSGTNVSTFHQLIVDGTGTLQSGDTTIGVRKFGGDCVAGIDVNLP